MHRFYFKIVPYVFILLFGFFSASCSDNENGSYTYVNTQAPSEAEILQQAYIYGYPLVIMDVSRQVMTNVKDPAQKAPVNQLHYGLSLPDHTYTDVVRVNNDTLYLTGWLDLREEPVVFETPDTSERYYVAQLMDGWTNVTASIGKRTTGTKAGRFLIAGPGWSGPAPQGFDLIQSPTPLAWLIVRVQVNGHDDLEAAAGISKRFTLCPLQAYESGDGLPEGVYNPAVSDEAPVQQVAEMSAADFFSLLCRLMAENSPYAEDAEILGKMKRVGIAPGGVFDPLKLTAQGREALKNLPAQAAGFMEEDIAKRYPLENGWQVYREKLGEFGTDYVLRAQVAMHGLGANLVADALYYTALTDGDGAAADGSANRYRLHFTQEPPTHAFWSLTLYNDRGFLSENVLGRYAIGDRDDLIRNADNSVTLYIQHESPGPELEKNWLPAPAGKFDMTLRNYWPDPQAWPVPAVEKVR